MSEKEQFIEAVRYDEYCELELPTGDVLITDWEGDGTFNPHVQPKDEDATRAAEIGEAISETLEVEVETVEVDAAKGVSPIYYPFMERPE